jgi:hypothetical protein
MKLNANVRDMVFVLFALAAAATSASDADRDLQWCAHHLADIVQVPTAKQVPEMVLKMSDTSRLEEILRCEDQLAPLPNGAGCKGDGVHVPFWRSDAERALATATHRRCAMLQNLTALGRVREIVLGITSRMVIVGYGGTPGNTDYEAGNPDQSSVNAPMPEGNVSRVTEAVVTYYGASLTLRPFLLAANLLLQRPPSAPFVFQGKAGTAKAEVERSASFYDPQTATVHIARVRWVRNIYAGTIAETFPLLAKPYRSHSIRLHNGDMYTVHPRAITHGYVVMGGGTWDMRFTGGKRLPGISLTDDPRNVTAVKAYWSKNMAALARLVEVERSDNASAIGALPVFWREQPLPRCESHRYAGRKKAGLQCEAVLRSVAVPHFRRAAQAALEQVGIITVPVDHLVTPWAVDNSSASMPADAALPAAIWQRSAAEAPLADRLCPMWDGIHLEGPCMLLQLYTYWSLVAMHRAIVSKPSAVSPRSTTLPAQSAVATQMSVASESEAPTLPVQRSGSSEARGGDARVWLPVPPMAVQVSGVTLLVVAVVLWFRR